MSLENLKAEALDAFGLFDVSIGEPEDVNLDDFMKNRFVLSCRVFEQGAMAGCSVIQQPSFVRLEND